MDFVEELRTLTEEREALNERVRLEYERQGLPTHVPLVAREDDAEMMALLQDVESLKIREDALWSRVKPQ